LLKLEQIISNANSAVLKIAARYLKDVETAILIGGCTDSIEVTRNSPEARRSTVLSARGKMFANFR